MKKNEKFMIEKIAAKNEMKNAYILLTYIISFFIWNACITMLLCYKISNAAITFTFFIKAEKFNMRYWAE